MNADTFSAQLLAWVQTGNEAALIRALRSPYSGVPHDTAAAYATLGTHAGSLLDAMQSSRLPLPNDEREAVLRFVERARSVTTAGDIRAAFGLNAERGQIGGPATLTLAAAASPDAQSGVRARYGHFSASALNAYAECPRKWYYRYVCSAVDDPGSSAATYGTAFHLALEEFHEEFAHPDPADEAVMRTKIAVYVNTAFERYRSDFTYAVEAELHRRRAQRTAQRYIDWLVAEARRAPFTVIGRELQTDLDLEGFAFVGYIDRLDRDDATGATGIFDYKTGSIATTAAEYRDSVRNFEDFQLPFYYWARSAAGDRVTRLALIPLKDALLDVRPVSLEVVPVATPDLKRSVSPTGTIGVNELERARARMIEICGELTSGKTSAFPVATDPSACTYCAYKSACIDRPFDERESFGR